jgi:Carboxypeptidase regulatory-like domain
VRGLCWARFFLCLIVVTVFNSPSLQADVTGSIFGTVTDPSDAVISAAHVTLRNLDTGLSRNTSTGSIGSYQFLAVPAGENYVVGVEAKGFQKANQFERFW